jgi:hypothetical protein
MRAENFAGELLAELKANKQRDQGKAVIENHGRDLLP